MISRKEKAINARRLSMILLFAVLFVAIFGLFAGVNFNEHGMMMSCVFSPGNSAMCGMDLAEHLTAWRHSSWAVLPLAVAQLLLAMLVILGISTLAGSVDYFVLFVCCWSRRRLFKDFLLKPFTPFAFALSQGIIHPKVY